MTIVKGISSGATIFARQSSDIVYRTLSTFFIHKTGCKKSQAQTGAVTLIQRFGSALNLNVHFHMLMHDGVYREDEYKQLRFRQTKSPTKAELEQRAHTLSHRIAGFLQRKGLLERDMENSWLTLNEEVDEALSQIHGSSITKVAKTCFARMLKKAVQNFPR